MGPNVFGHIRGPLWTTPYAQPGFLPLESRIMRLERALERAQLTTEALWTLLRDKTGLTDEELVARVQEIDLTDGHLDGKVRRPAADCPQCKRKVSPRFENCAYCGAPVGRSPFE